VLNPYSASQIGSSYSGNLLGLLGFLGFLGFINSSHEIYYGFYKFSNVPIWLAE
jgi:hypothetical protein